MTEENDISQMQFRFSEENGRERKGNDAKKEREKLRKERKKEKSYNF